MAKEKTVYFGARVPEEDYKKFVDLFDDGRGRVIYGASTWFIMTALLFFNEEMEKNDTPVLRERVRNIAKRMMQDRNGE